MMNCIRNASSDFANGICRDRPFFEAVVNCRPSFGTHLSMYITNVSVENFKPTDGSDPSMYMVKGFYRYS